MTNLEKVRSLVKSKCKETDWKYHVLPVVKYAKMLVRKLNADEELAELGALLHDIGWIEDEKNDPVHEKVGAPIAEKILRDFGYSENVIEEVKHCIESHRSSKDVQPRTIIAKIVANADGMSHFDVPYFLQMGLRKKNNNLEETVRWTLDVVERNWNKKLTLPEAREIMKEKYEAARLMLNSTLELANEE